MCLAFSGKDRDRCAADALGFGDEGTAVARISAGSRCNRPNTAHMQDIAQSAETPQRVERCIDGIGRQKTGRLNLPA
jgi:hypothetical protein